VMDFAVDRAVTVEEHRLWQPTRRRGVLRRPRRGPM
jgi:hypothetical protein